MSYFAHVTIVLTYGHVAWLAVRQSIGTLFFLSLCLMVLCVDIFVQFNTGYITKSAIILDRQRVVNRYTHYYIYLDVVLCVVIFVSLASGFYYLNYGILLVFFKFLRMFEIDAILMRRFTTRVTIRMLY